jgi:DNA-binding beta-propeller fold protein YncE
MRHALLTMVAAAVAASCTPADRGSSSDPPVLECHRFERYLLVANRTSPEIAVIDLDLDEVIGRIAIGEIPDQVVFSGTRAKLIASHLDARSVTVFDLQTTEIEAVIDLGFRPEQLELDPSGRTFAVSSGADDRVSVISLQPVEEMFRLSDVGGPSDLLFSRDTRLLFVASGSAPRIAVVDAWTGDPLEPMSLGGPETGGITDLASAGPLGFALHGASGEISVFDLRARSAIATLVVPGPAKRAFPAADGRKILLPNERDGTVSIISAWPVRSLAETARLPAAPGIFAIYTNASGASAALLRDDSNSLLMLSLEGSSQREISLPAQPEASVVADAGQRLYLSLSGSDQIAVIDLETEALAKLIDGVGGQPSGVQVAGALGPCH